MKVNGVDVIQMAMDSRLTRSQALLTVAVLVFGGRSGRIPWPQLKELAHIGSDKVLARTVRELESLGILHVYRHMNGGMRLGSEYRIDTEALYERYRNRIMTRPPHKKQVCSVCGQVMAGERRGEV